MAGRILSDGRRASELVATTDRHAHLVPGIPGNFSHGPRSRQIKEKRRKSAWRRKQCVGSTTRECFDYAVLPRRVPALHADLVQQPSDTAHPYSAALITVRDGKRVINLNLSPAPAYNSYTPYYPAPFSDNLAYGTY
ncbi:hypothetical protein OKW29_002983 [Paraburkholderia sp. CI3]